MTSDPKPAKTRRATCACGALALDCEGEPVRLSMCHCLACRQRTGSIFGVQARYARDKVEITGMAHEHLRVGDSGGRLTFHFCPTCGSTVYYRFEHHGAFIGVPVGAFADPAFPPPSVSVYEARRSPWADMPNLVIERHE